LSSRGPPSTVATRAPTLELTFSPPGGYYDRDVFVEIDCPHPDATVVFTLDGSTPTPTEGTTYVGPLRLDADTPSVTVIRARAILPGGELGPVEDASYFVRVPAMLPMISLIVRPGDLWDEETGIYANPFERGAAWERPVHITYVDRDRRSGFHVPAGLRIHGESTRGADKKALRLHFRSEYGLNRLAYPLFEHGEIQSFKRVILHNSGQDSSLGQGNWLAMRSRLVSDLALALGGCAARSRPVLVFLNGQPWGIYQIRERIDHWFLADHYGAEHVDLLDTPAIKGSEAAVEGDRQHWDELMHFVETHSLADQANYMYVQSQVDLANLIDYTILQVYSANVDWLHTNITQFRARTAGGQWRWCFWDSDFSLGLAQHSEVDSNIVRDVLNPDHPKTGGAETLLLRKLLENPRFYNRFLTRTSDLLNTNLSPDAVLALVDALAAEVSPDLFHETGRWQRPSDDWHASVEALRTFVRARPDVVRQHYVEAFSLGGTTALTFAPASAGTGYVAVNGTLVPELPWQGRYFQDTEIEITAVPAPGYRFAGWGAPAPAQTAVLSVTVDKAMAFVPRFEPVDKDDARPLDVVIAGLCADRDDVEGDCFELRVKRRGGADLRGWRVTDNDTKTATDEGSLILLPNAALAHVPRDTLVRIIATRTAGNDARFPQDDLDTWDRVMVLYAGNGNLDAVTDPWFSLGPVDNLVLLAPGPTDAFSDDRGVDMVGNAAVTPASFGVLSDGVVGRTGSNAQTR
jgi:hypothetical protein